MKKEIKFKIWGRVFILPYWIKYIVLTLLIAVALILGYFLQSKDRDSLVVVTPDPTATPSPEIAAASTPGSVIYVYVVGEVNAPGVYELNTGAMISQAVSAAGGFTDSADPEAINMVETLTTNTMIKVPAVGEPVSQIVVQDGSDSGTTNKKVNINTAGAEELCSLSGVGESTAKKIISYREANGPFASVEDIMNVPGIKEARFLAIKEDICVG